MTMYILMWNDDKTDYFYAGEVLGMFDSLERAKANITASVADLVRKGFANYCGYYWVLKTKPNTVANDKNWEMVYEFER